MPRATRRAATAVVVAVLCAAPAPPARADDAAMRAGILPALDALIPKERAVNRALGRVARLSVRAAPGSYRAARRAALRAEPKARRAMEATEAFGGLLLGQQPSSERGERVKRLLLRALAVEGDGFRLVCRSLRAYARGSTVRANALVREAGTRLRRSARMARRAGTMLARL